MTAKAQLPKVRLSWTDNKSALIELLYALHYQGSFNNGNADIKEIAIYFETIFNVDLGQYRRTFLEIRDRKSDKTKFINSLEKELLKRMEETDESF